MDPNTMTEEAAPRLDGRWAVITGGSKGIGLGIAHRFAAAGSNLVLVARDQAALDDARDEICALAPNVEVRVAPVDLRDTGAIDALFDDVVASLDRLDVLVANAGSGAIRPLLDLTLEEWDHTMALNLTGVFRTSQLAARRMVKDGGDEDHAILVVSSIRAHGVRPGRLAYAVTKAGVNQFVRAAAYELAEHGVRVNALSPGITATPLALEGNPEVFEQMASTVPMGRAGTPQDMASAALYLCSPMASFVTGANLVVDGGESLY